MCPYASTLDFLLEQMRGKSHKVTEWNRILCVFCACGGGEEEKKERSGVMKRKERKSLSRRETALISPYFFPPPFPTISRERERQETMHQVDQVMQNKGKEKKSHDDDVDDMAY